MTRTVRGARVLITGAGSGMGLRYAQRALSEGAASISLWDVNEIALERAAGEFAAWTQAVQPRRGTVVRTRVVDLLDPEAIAAAAAAELDAGGAPDVLINNAGIVPPNDYYWETATADTERTLAVNTLAHLLVTRHLLPAMIADAGRAKRILNVSSASATVANPRMSVYAASKWALTGWSDSLRLELAQAGHAHIRVTTFCPSYVSTGMFAGASAMFLTPILRPEQAVAAAWAAMLRGRAMELTPRTVWLGRALRALLPPALWDPLAELMGITRSMEHFTGRG